MGTFLNAGSEFLINNGYVDEGQLAGRENLANGGEDYTGVPQAYLNYILFDKEYNVIEGKKLQISEEGKFEIGDTNLGLHEHLQIDPITIAKEGYIYIYLSNQTPGSEVYFDDLLITHYQTTIIQKDDYYPFGLTLNGLSSSRENALGNRYLFNGKELQTDLGLNWIDYGARMYDPSISRWNAIDPSSDKYLSFSPYHFSGLNPVIAYDADGADWFVFHDGRPTWQPISGGFYDNAGEYYPSLGSNPNIAPTGAFDVYRQFGGGFSDGFYASFDNPIANSARAAMGKASIVFAPIVAAPAIIYFGPMLASASHLVRPMITQAVMNNWRQAVFDAGTQLAFNSIRTGSLTEGFNSVNWTSTGVSLVNPLGRFGTFTSTVGNSMLAESFQFSVTEFRSVLNSKVEWQDVGFSGMFSAFTYGGFKGLGSMNAELNRLSSARLLSTYGENPMLGNLSSYQYRDWQNLTMMKGFSGSYLNNIGSFNSTGNYFGYTNMFFNNGFNSFK